MNLMTAFGKNLTNEGFISDLKEFCGQQTWMPTSDTEILALDNFYFYSWSGDKWIAPVVEKFYDADEGLIGRGMLALMFMEVYKVQLDRLWEDFVTEYDPVASYDVHEEMNYDHDGGGTREKQGTETNTRTGSINDYGTVTTRNKAWAYDSNSSSDVSESTVTYGATGVPRSTLYNDVMDTKVYGGRIDTSTETADDTLTSHKYGSLGIASPAQLLKLDIELWRLNFYTTILFPRIDKFLTLPIY